MDEIMCMVCGRPVEQPPMYSPGSDGRTVHQAPRCVCWKCALRILGEKREYVFTADYCPQCGVCPNIKSRVQYEAELIVTQPALGGIIAKKLLAGYFRAGWWTRRKMRKAVEAYLKNAGV